MRRPFAQVPQPGTESLRIHKSPEAVAGVLAGTDEAIALEGLRAHSFPDAATDVVASLDAGTKLKVSAIDTDKAGNVWLRAQLPDSIGNAAPVFVQMPPRQERKTSFWAGSSMNSI